MPCLIVVFALFVPRLTLFFIWLLTDWLSQAYDTWLWPLLGFFLMPYTTLAYMGAMLNNNHEVSGIWLILVIIAVVVDLTGQGHSARSRRRGD